MTPLHLSCRKILEAEHGAVLDLDAIAETIRDAAPGGDEGRAQTGSPRGGGRVVASRRSDIGLYNVMRHVVVAMDAGGPALLSALENWDGRCLVSLSSGTGTETATTGDFAFLDDVSSQQDAMWRHIRSAGNAAPLGTTIGASKLFAVYNDRIWDSVFLLADLLRELDSGQDYQRILHSRAQNILPVGDIVGLCADVRCDEVLKGSQDFRDLRENTEISWHSSLPRRWDVPGGQRVARLLADLGARPHPPGEGFTVLVSLEVEKRQWIEQVEGIGEFLLVLRDRVGAVHVLVNGMTANANGWIDPRFKVIEESESAIIETWRSRLGPGVRIDHLSGMTAADKAAAIRHADFFLAPAGSAALLPCLLDVPGVMYGVKNFIDQMQPLKDVARNISFIEGSYLADDAGYGLVAEWFSGAQVFSYSIPTDRFLAAALPALTARR